MNNIEKLVIIGAGPAGLTAGIYGARANLNPLIIEGPNPGGQLMSTSFIENWPGEKSILGANLMQNIKEHAKHFGSRFLSESVVSITLLEEKEKAKIEEKDLDKKYNQFLIKTNKNTEITAQSIIIASGASARKLGCPGESEFWGKGITSCAICDGFFYKDKKVFILGGGDTAMEDAHFMEKFTNDITVVHIADKLSASMAMQEKVLKSPNIKIIYNSTITKFYGHEKNQELETQFGSEHLSGIEVTNKITGEISNFKADGVFIAIGQKPNTDFLKGIVDISDWGYVITGKNGTSKSTSVKGIFAAGDCSDPYYKQAIVSCGAGCMAALDAERYLSNL